MEKKNFGLLETLALQVLFIFWIFQFVECRERATIMVIHYSRIFGQPPTQSRVSEFRNRLKRILLGILFGSLTGFAAAITIACLFRFMIKYMNKIPILSGPVTFYPKISAKNIESALLNATQTIGSSHNGKYYKVVLDNGFSVAVKKLEPFENTAVAEKKSTKRRIQRDLELLANLNHPNLMSLRAYIRQQNQISLIYDFAPNGSLEDVMARVRSNQLQIGWDVRHRIAVGVIKGLRHLHFECNPRVLHYDLKPSNVFLDEEFEPKLGDCGLMKIMPNIDGFLSDYMAPECSQSCRYLRYTDKSDVFSFGMILVVLLTGKIPSDPFFGEMGLGSFRRWLLHLQQASVTRECLDKSIIGEEIEEEEMLMVVRIAVVCLSDLPADRPSSEELVPMLTQLHSF